MIHKKTCSREQWDAFINEMRSGRIFECDQEMFDYWLGVLPPIHMNYIARLPNGKEVYAQFGFAEGEENVVAFWQGQGGRYFGCQTFEIAGRGFRHLHPPTIFKKRGQHIVTIEKAGQALTQDQRAFCAATLAHNSNTHAEALEAIYHHGLADNAADADQLIQDGEAL